MSRPRGTKRRSNSREPDARNSASTPRGSKHDRRDEKEMAGIIHKIEEKLHIGGEHKQEGHHKEEEEKHHEAEGHHKEEEKHHEAEGHHKEGGGGIVEKIKEKIHGGEEHGEEEKKDKKKKKKEKKKKHGEEHHGDSSSSSDSD
ncbi:hypothetical protein GW17_00025615 [Ensete ventricosum]|nr:hypothetical protein GW17_00025615 [Ensete ventricosum]